MTKKHFIIIARILNAEARNFKPESITRVAIDNIARNLAAEFRAVNPLFDSNRFMEAVNDTK